MPPKKAPAAELPPVSFQINALLNTIRCIAQYEDRLCVLLTEIRQTHTVSPEVHEELHALLERMPSHEYTDDLEAVREAAVVVPPASDKKKTEAKSPATKSAASRTAAPKTKAAKT